MAKLYNRVAVTTATTGTGTVTLGAALSDVFLTFAEAGVQNADVVTYLITEGTDFEMGRGTYTVSGTTLSRDTVLNSKIGGTAGTTKMTLAGGAEVRIVAAAEDIPENAAALPFTPAGSIAATDVQAAIEELDTEKEPADADLTAIAALTGTGVARRTGTDTWALLSYTASTSFVPTFTFSTPGDLSVAYTIQTGRYIRFGNFVWFRAQLTFEPTYTTASGSARIDDLPVTSLSVANSHTAVTLAQISNVVFGSDKMLTAKVFNNAAFVSFDRVIGSSATALAGPTQFPSGTEFQLSLSGVYPV